MNTNEIYDEALALTVKHFKPDFPKEEFTNIMSKTRGKTFNHQLEMILGKKSPLLADAIVYYEEYIHSDKTYKRIQILARAEKMLMKLKGEGYILALSTGMNPSLLSRLFQERIMPDVFEIVKNIHDISDPELQKPNPMILIDIITNLGISPSQCIYVGDTEDDIEMATRGGFIPMAVLTGRINKEFAKLKGARLILASVLELPKCLKIINQ